MKAADLLEGIPKVPNEGRVPAVPLLPPVRPSGCGTYGADGEPGSARGVGGEGARNDETPDLRGALLAVLGRLDKMVTASTSRAAGDTVPERDSAGAHAPGGR